MLQNIDCGYSLEPPTENFQFLQLKKSLYIAKACFRNEEGENLKEGETLKEGENLKEGEKNILVMKTKHTRKTCPCNEYPPNSHFCIVKLGFAGVYVFFLFFLLSKT